MNITENMLDELRLSVRSRLSDFRWSHTEGVERMAARLAKIYAPEIENEMRAAALLHDITKEKKTDDQVEICGRYRYKLRDDEIGSPAILHAITASLVIPDEYPVFAADAIISAVRWHTTGREGMSLSDKIIYLADYIEDTRKYEDCIALRNEFFSAEPEKMDKKERLDHLNRVLLHSFEITIEDLTEKGKIIESGTLEAAESLQKELENI